LAVSIETTSVPDNEISKLTEELARSMLGKAYELNDSVEAISMIIENLMKQPKKPPSIYMDLEVANLSQQNSILTLQIHEAP
jgi:hypothetical protein